MLSYLFISSDNKDSSNSNLIKKNTIIPTIQINPDDRIITDGTITELDFNNQEASPSADNVDSYLSFSLQTGKAAEESSDSSNIYSYSGKEIKNLQVFDASGKEISYKDLKTGLRIKISTVLSSDQLIDNIKIKIIE